jgi:hypothetical protein
LRLRRFLPALLALLVFAVPASASASSETLYLDSHDLANDGSAGPVSTSSPLRSGAFYLVQVTGTFSEWAAPEWNFGTCGNPERRPYFLSPGTDNGPAAIDAETVFGGPTDSFACRAAGLPLHSSEFKIDTGSGPVHKEPLGGPFTRPALFHTYFYVLRGQGDTASFKFSLTDQPTSDNYGRLQITVRGADRDDCKNGGWKDFSVFKNQGDCVSYQSTDGRNGPSGW